MILHRQKTSRLIKDVMSAIELHPGATCKELSAILGGEVTADQMKHITLGLTRQGRLLRKPQKKTQFGGRASFMHWIVDAIEPASSSDPNLDGRVEALTKQVEGLTRIIEQAYRRFPDLRVDPITLRARKALVENTKDSQPELAKDVAAGKEDDCLAIQMYKQAWSDCEQEAYPGCQVQVGR